MFVDYEGYRFPVRLDNPWAVAKVLNQSKGKISAKDLKKAASSTNSGSNKNTILISAQAKVYKFKKVFTFYNLDLTILK